MKYIGENAIKKLISLIKGDLAKKQDSITVSGLLKGDGTTISAAVAEMDYVTPDGMNSAVAEAKPFIVTMNNDNTTNKTVTEIKAAYDAGRTCVLAYSTDLLALVVVDDKIAAFSTAIVTEVSLTNLTRVVTVIVTNGNRATVKSTDCQNMITATGLLKGDGNGGVSAAIPGTDYMAQPTGGSIGQVLTKTADGQEWQDREKDLFIVTISAVGNQTFTADKTFLEIQEAYNAGKVCFALTTFGSRLLLPVAQLTTDTMVSFSTLISSDTHAMLLIRADNSIEASTKQFQKYITASGLLKGNGDGSVSAAVAGTDYMAPVTGGTAGQVLTKTTDGQEWQDREKDLFVVTISGDDSSGYTADKTFSEIKAAYDEGKTVVAITVVNSMVCPLFLVYIADELVQFTAALFDNISATLSITMDKNNNIARELIYNQVVITASGLLKGDGIGGVSAATAGTDYMVPPTGGTAGQVLTKTANSSEWADAPKSLPDGGIVGDALVKSTDGGSWETPVEASLVDLPVITASTTDLTAGTSPLATGELYVVYE